jgi:hypothetical protein
LLVLLAMVGWSIAVVGHAQRLYQRARALGEQSQAILPLDQASGAGSGVWGLTEIRQLRERVEGVAEEAEALQALTTWLTTPLAQQKVWPALAVRAELAHEGLEVVVNLADTAWWVLLEVQSDLETDGELNRAPGVPVLMQANTLARAVGAMQQNRAKVLAASVSLQRMAAIAPTVSWASRWQPTCHQIALALDGLAALVATVTEQPDAHFLLILQNSDELRASGGFISAAVVVRLQGMRLEEFRYLNSYDVESYWQTHPTAPAPLQEVMGASILLFRDANWAADFTEAAEVLAALYELDMREHIDAVVACNMTFLELLLEAVGPVPVPEYEVTLTAENVVATAVEFWERPLGAASIEQRDQAFMDWLTHRKEFGRAALTALVPRLQTLRGMALWRLLQAITRAVDAGQLLAWVPDNPLAQSDLERMGISGQVRLTGDADLMVVDSNVGWNKVDRHIERAVDYVLTQSAGGWQAEVYLTYVNHASAALAQCEHRSRYEDSYEAMTQQCYWNYGRLLVPPHSVLVKTTGLTSPVVQDAESGQRAYGFLVVVPPGEQRTVGLAYFIPQQEQAVTAATQQLALTIQAQPGVRRAVRVWVRPDSVVRPDKLPADWQFEAGSGFFWSGEPLKKQTAVVRWQVRE